MANYEAIGLNFSVDTSDLKAGVEQAKKIISSASKEFKNATAGMDNWRKSTEGVTAKLKELETKMTVQTQVVDGYKKEIERVKNLEGDHSEELRRLVDKLNDAETKVKTTAKQIKTFSNTLENLREEEIKAGSATEKLGKKINQQEKDVASLTKKYKDAVLQFGANSDEAKGLARQLEIATSELNQNKKAMAQVDAQADRLAESMNDLGDEAREAGDGFTVFKGVIANLISTGINNFVNGLKNAVSESREFRIEQGKLLESMSDSGYSAEYTGKKFDELNDIFGDSTMSATAISNFGAIGLAEKDLSRILEASVGIWAKYGDSMPIDGLAESINETTKVGKVTGNLADALNWASENEDDFNEKLAKCTSEQERQELVIKTLEKGYGKLAKSYKENNKDLIASNKASNDYSKAMANLAKRVEPILTAIKQGFADVAKEMLKMSKDIDFKAITKGIADAFGWLINNCIPFLKNNLPTILSLIAGIGTAFLAWKVQGVISSLITGVQGLVTALIAATTAQNGLNLAMKANIIGALVGVILALVTAFMTLWKTSDDFRVFWIGLWETIKTYANNTIDFLSWAFENLWGGIKETWGNVASWFGEKWTKISNGAAALKDSVTNAFNNAWANVKRAWGNVGNWFNNIWSGIKNTFKNIDNWFGDKFGEAWANIKQAFSGVTNFFKNMWDDITSSFKGIGGKIADAIGGSFKASINGVISMIERALNNIPRAINGALKYINMLPNVNVAPMPNVSLPRLKKGGVVKKSTIAEIGEDGAEAVVPLENNTQWIDKLAGKISSAIATGDVGTYGSASTSSINHELAKTNNTLDEVNKKLLESSQSSDSWSNSIEGINGQAELLSNKYDAQQVKLQLLNREYELAKEVSQSMGGVVTTEMKKTAQEIENLKSEMEATKEEAGKLKNALDNLSIGESSAEPTLKKWGDLFKWAKSSEGFIQFAKDLETSYTNIAGKLGNVFGQINSIQQLTLQNKLEDVKNEAKEKEKVYNEQLQTLENTYNEENELLKSKYQQGLITEADYYNKLDALDAKRITDATRLEEEKAKSDLKLKQEQDKLSEKIFKANQKSQIANVWVNAGAGIARAWAENFWPIALGISGLIGAQASLQTSNIKKQKFVPAFAKGGVINRPTIGLVGEAGKEAIIPLENNLGWIKELAGSIAGIMGDTNNAYNTSAFNNSNVNNFTQIINAPKQPSRIEIYRDTKNLLALKGGR